MKAQEFVQRLSRLAPSVGELTRVGMTAAGAGSLRERYLCKQRGVESQEADPLLALLRGWDLSKVGIGMIGFLPEPQELADKTHIGEVESDPLYIMHETGELLGEELHVPGYVLWTVARDGASFLDALIPAAEFLTERCLKIVDRDDLDSARKAAHYCASLAGGYDYLQFFGVMLGADFDINFDAER